MTSSASSPPTYCLVVRRRLSGFGTACGQGGGSATPPDARPGGHRDRCGVRGSRGAPAAAAGHLEGKLSRSEGKLSQLEGKLAHSDGKLSHLDGKLSQLEGKLSQLEGER